jgi:nucleotide-binding universal stress UspA family protein
MFAKVLAALDSSPVDMQVFNEAVSIAKTNNANLMLLHALSLDEQDSPARSGFPTADYYLELSNEALASYQKKLKEYADRWLDTLRSLTDSATKAGVPTEFSQNIGRAERVICDLAHTWGADLIVMGRKKHSEVGEFLFSSASNYVFHHAKCSVLFVHN